MIGDAFEVSRIVGRLIAYSSAALGGGLALGLATKAGWIDTLTDNA